jgi:hypothetical protein
MVDLTAEKLAELYKYRLPGFLLASNEVIYPNYPGASILNLPATVCSLLGVPSIASASLDASLIEPLGDNLRHVVLVLVDSLSFQRLQRWMADGTTPVWSRLAQQGVFAPLTSIVPSTTSAALTTLWTGRSAYEHGVMGYEMWMKEYGMVVNTIQHAPASFDGLAGSLRHAGFNPLEYLSFPTLGEHLTAHHVQVNAFQHYTIARSGLSQMLFKEVRVHTFNSAADLWIGVRRTLENRPAQRTYSWVYWGDLDYFGHRHGPDSEYVASGFSQFSLAFERYFWEQLSPERRADTMVILAADHGMLQTDPDPFFELRGHVSLARRLHLPPTGENRLMYLFPRAGQVEAVREYFERTWRGGFQVNDAAYLAESGLFGTGKPHPRLLERLGDLIVIPTGKMYLWWAAGENILLGRHGGLHPDEMLVPFLAARLETA